MSDSIRESLSHIVRIKSNGSASPAAKAEIIVTLIHLEAGKVKEAEMSALNAASHLGSLSGNKIVNNAIGLRGRLLEYIEKVKDADSKLAEDLNGILKRSE